jgi:hypothetical protein
LARKPLHKLRWHPEPRPTHCAARGAQNWLHVWQGWVVFGCVLWRLAYAGCPPVLVAGVYFADVASKAAGHVHATKKNPHGQTLLSHLRADSSPRRAGLLILSEVALGNCYELQKASYMVRYICANILPQRCWFSCFLSSASATGAVPCTLPRFHMFSLLILLAASGEQSTKGVGKLMPDPKGQFELCVTHGCFAVAHVCFAQGRRHHANGQLR